MSFWVVPSSAARGTPRRLGRDDVHRPDRRGRGVDRHRRADPVERQAREEELHVREAAHRHPARPELALRLRVVGVVAVEGRHVVGDREAGLAGIEQLAEAGVRVLGAAEPREHAHRPRAGPVPGGVDAAGERRLSREPDVPGRVEAGVAARAVAERVAVMVDGGRPAGARRLAVRASRAQSHGPYSPSIGRSPSVVNRSRRSGTRSSEGARRSTRQARRRAGHASGRSLMRGTLARGRGRPGWLRCGRRRARDLDEAAASGRPGWRAPPPRGCRRGPRRAARSPARAGRPAT